MLKTILAKKDGVPLDIHTGLNDHPTLIAEGLRTLGAQWQSSTITTATTTTVVEVKPRRGILLTDLVIILSKKVASATIVVRFYDGTNTESLFTFDAETASFQFSHAFQGGLRGWDDADFQIVTNQETTVAVLVGYVHTAPEQTRDYGIWVAER